MCELRKHALGTESVHATWAARSFGSFWRQRLSIAIQAGTARELVRVIAAGEVEVRKAIGRWRVGARARFKSMSGDLPARMPLF